MSEASFLPLKRRPNTLLEDTTWGAFRKICVCYWGWNMWLIWLYLLDPFFWMKSDFRWPWHHRMKSPDVDEDADAKQNPRTKLNETCSLRLVVWGWWKLFFLQSSLQACQLRHFQCAGMADFFLQRDAKKNDHSVWHALFTIWVHFVTFFLLHFNKSHRPQLSTFLGTKTFLRNCLDRRTRRKRRRKRMRNPTRRIRQCASSILNDVAWFSTKVMETNFPPKHIVIILLIEEILEKPGMIHLENACEAIKLNLFVALESISPISPRKTLVVMIGDTNERVGWTIESSKIMTQKLLVKF